MSESQCDASANPYIHWASRLLCSGAATNGWEAINLALTLINGSQLAKGAEPLAATELGLTDPAVVERHAVEASLASPIVGKANRQRLVIPSLAAL